MTAALRPAVLADAADEWLVTADGTPLLWAAPVRRPLAVTRAQPMSAILLLDRLDLVLGWTSPLQLTLSADGAPLDLYGCEVEAVLERPDGTSVIRAVELIDPARGIVAWPLEEADLLFGAPALRAEIVGWLRFRVTDAAGRSFACPNRHPIPVTVRT